MEEGDAPAQRTSRSTAPPNRLGQLTEDRLCEIINKTFEKLKPTHLLAGIVVICTKCSDEHGLSDSKPSSGTGVQDSPQGRELVLHTADPSLIHGTTDGP